MPHTFNSRLHESRRRSSVDILPSVLYGIKTFQDSQMQHALFSKTGEIDVEVQRDPFEGMEYIQIGRQVARLWKKER